MGTHGDDRTVLVAPDEHEVHELLTVGDDHEPGAHMAGDGHRHDADGPGAGDEHVLADQIEGQRGVDGVAERIEDGGDVVGYGWLDIVWGDVNLIGRGGKYFPCPGADFGRGQGTPTTAG